MRINFHLRGAEWKRRFTGPGRLSAHRVALSSSVTPFGQWDFLRDLWFVAIRSAYVWRRRNTGYL
ncbi:hypothetical protein GCM10009414_27340 [Tatumella terrea]